MKTATRHAVMDASPIVYIGFALNQTCLSSPYDYGKIFDSKFNLILFTQHQRHFIM